MGGKILAEEVRKWSTPIASDSVGCVQSEKALAKGFKPRLTEQANRWPTPSACTRDGTKAGGHAGLAGGSGNRAKLYKLLGKKEGKKLGSQALNPDWVEWLMGWPIRWTDIEPLTATDFMDGDSFDFWRSNIPSWWDEDPADAGYIPRTTDQKPNRVNRLKALGNGQVPLCAAVAWNLLMEGDS